MQHVVAHHGQRHDVEEHHHGIHHGNGAPTLEVVLAVKTQIDGETADEQQHQERLAQHFGAEARLVGLAAFRLLDERLDDAFRLFVNNFSAVNHLLAALHHAAGQRNALLQVAQARLAALLFVNQVRHNVVVQVATLQQRVVLAEQRVLKQFLVGRLGRVDGGHAHADGLLAAHNANHLHRVLRQSVILLGPHDALVVELVQAVGNDADKVGRQSRNALAEVLCELVDGLALRLFVDFVVGLIFPHYAVALCLNGCVRLVDGEIEGGCEVGIAPGLALLNLEGQLAVARHGPHNEYDADDHQGYAYQQVVPCNVFAELDFTHFLAQYYNYIPF